MTELAADTTDTAPDTQRSVWVRLWPVYVILGGLALALSQGWHTHLSPASLADNAAWLAAAVERNVWLVLLAFTGIYIVATSFMVPASALTIGGGFLFGLAVGAPATVVGATIGASILFIAARSSVGHVLRGVAGPFLSKMEAGFNEAPLSYLFSLRLIPVFPFAVANIAPALLGARFRDYLLSTALGIVPGTIAYTWIGAGLRGTLLDAAEAGESVDVGALVGAAAANLVPAFFALGVVALIPAVWKRVRRTAA